MRKIEIVQGYIWVEGIPEQFAYEPGKVFESTLLAPARDNRSICFAAIRQIYIYGPRAEYGTLGASFTPDATDRLIIQVVASARQSADSLGAGLEENYAEAILHEAEQSPLLRDFGGGILRFDHALQHPIDSNEAIFRILARALVSILPLTDPSDAVLNTLINQARQDVQREIAEATKIRRSR